MRHVRLIANGALGGDATWCLECVPEEVTMLALVRALRAVLELRARAPPSEPGDRFVARHTGPTATVGPWTRNP
jgi:hypothetical protein